MTILPSNLVTSLAGASVTPPTTPKRTPREEDARRGPRRTQRDEFVQSAPDVRSEDALRNLKGGTDQEEREDAERRQHYTSKEQAKPRLDVAG